MTQLAVAGPRLVVVDALGDFGWLFVRPAERAGSLVFWSY